MMEFNFKGIKVEATAEMSSKIYKNAMSEKRTRLEKNVIVTVQFWDFIILNGDLLELAFIKSTLQYFMQCFWKRMSKDGSKIELGKELLHATQSLHFEARQKNKEHFLYVYMLERGNLSKEVYLDAQEVLMLDIAIGKAINWLSPDTIESTSMSYTARY